MHARLRLPSSRPSKGEGKAIREAKRWFKGKTYQWNKQLDAFYQEASRIEDPDLKWVVSILLHALLIDRAAFFLKTQSPNKRVHLTIPYISVDEEVVDLVEEMLGVDGAFEPAGNWVLSALKGSSAPFIAWAFDSFDVDPGIDVHVTCDRAVFGSKSCKIVGVVAEKDRKKLIRLDKMMSDYPTGRSRAPDWVYGLPSPE